MNKLSLIKVDESNFVECFNLRLRKDQEKFVSHPIRSLAQAYVYYNQCTPFAIYNEDIMIGYVMVIYDYDEESYNIWHMMIDERYQNKGYGTQAINLCLNHIKTKQFGSSNEVILTCSPDNNIAIKIYERIGFENIGYDGDEITMKLII